MSKIGIDARLYSQTGVGVYLRNLLYFLEKIAKRGIFFYIYLLPEDYAKVKFTSKYFIKKPTYSSWHTFSEQFDFVKILYSDSLDLVHFTYFSYPVFYKKRFISTIHDTTPLSFKTGRASTKNPILYYIKHLAFRFVLRQQVVNSAKIITPTNTVKRQLVSIYGKKYESKIYPICEGVDYELMNISHSRESGNLLNRSPIKSGMTIKNPFFLYVGNFYPHKNVERLIKAFAKVKTKAKLILVGPDDYFAAKLYRCIDTTIQERVVFYHNASKEDLVFFYENALALINPSLSEGFGLPLVEAMYFNLPIIASNIDVFQEILEKSYISFDPLSIGDITKKIEFFLKRRPSINYAKILEKFSFEEMSKKTFQLYKEVLQAKGR